MPLFKPPLETTNTSTLNGGDKGGVWILLFSEVTLFQRNIATILSLIVGYNMFTLCRIVLMKAGKSYWIHLRLLFMNKNCDFGAFAERNGNHTATKPSQPMAPAHCSMSVNNLFQLCATAVYTKLDTKNHPLYCEHSLNWSHLFKEHCREHLCPPQCSSLQRGTAY